MSLALKNRKFLVSIFIMSVIFIYGMMTAEVHASMKTIYATNYSELKTALESDEDTHVIVNTFSTPSGKYYNLISGTDYQQIPEQLLDNSSIYTCGAINIPTAKTKVLTLNTTVDCRASNTNSGNYLFSFINNRGYLTIDGKGTLAVSFNASLYTNAIIFNQGTLTIEDPITLDATCHTVDVYGYAVYNYSGTFDISDGTYIGCKALKGSGGDCAALNQKTKDTKKQSTISGGTFKISNGSSSCFGLMATDTQNIKLSGGKFQGIITSQNNVSGMRLTELLEKDCKYTKNGTDYDASSLVKTNDTLEVIDKKIIPLVEVVMDEPTEGTSLNVAPTVKTDRVTYYAHDWYDEKGNKLFSSSNSLVGGNTYTLKVRISTLRKV